MRVIGNFGRQCRAIWNRWMAGEWQSFPGDILMQRKRWSAPENCAPRPDFQPSAEVGVKACNPPELPSRIQGSGPHVRRFLCALASLPLSTQLHSHGREG